MKILSAVDSVFGMAEESTTEYGVMSIPDMTVTPHPNRVSAGLSIAKMPRNRDKYTPVLVYRKSPEHEWLSVWTHQRPYDLT